MTEYTMMLQMMELRPNIIAATREEVTNNLTSALHKTIQAVSKGIPSLDGGGWEILSHDLTRLDRHLIVSFLLHRKK